MLMTEEEEEEDDGRCVEVKGGRERSGVIPLSKLP